MKKLIGTFGCLCCLYLIIAFGIQLFSKGHHIHYQFTKDEIEIKVEEQFYRRQRNTNDYYLLKVTYNKKLYTFQTEHNFRRAKKIIESIDFIEGDIYQCIYPIFKGKKQLTDVICQSNGILYHYDTISGKDKKIDEFVKSLSNYHVYDHDEKVIQTIGSASLYNSLIKNHYIGAENYRGLYLSHNQEITQNQLFEKDVYDRSIQAYIDSYYITADYHENYEFHEFQVLNMITGKKSVIVSNQAISLDSYIEGVIDHKIYLLDTNHKKQYKIDYQNKTVKEIGNVDKGIQIYEKGKWVTKNYADVLKNHYLFSPYEITNPYELGKYDRVDQVGNQHGYFYCYQKSGDTYYAYRSSIQDPSILTYLFSTKQIDKITYVDDYIYFQDGKYIKYYHDTTGLKTVYSDTEFTFNRSLSYGIVIS